MRPLILLPLVLLACADAADISDDARRDPSTWPTLVGTAERPAAVYTPSTADGSQDLPVIVVLHGYGATGDVQARYFRLTEQVDEGGYVLIVPDGNTDSDSRQFWNATDVCCDFEQTGVDDVAYLLDLIDQVQAKVPIDADRITFVGHSNGGFMGYRMACEAADRVAGIASLAGATFSDPALCGASEPVSVLQIHGTADSTIRYEGGGLPIGEGRHPGAEESVAYWADLGGCGPLQAEGRADYLATRAGEDSARSVHPDCDGVDVALWTLEEGVHVPVLTEAFDADLLAWLLAQSR